MPRGLTDSADPIFEALAVTATPFDQASSPIQRPRDSQIVQVVFRITNVSGSISIDLELRSLLPSASRVLLTPPTLAGAAFDHIAVGVGLVSGGFSGAAYFKAEPAPALFDLRVQNGGTGTCTFDAWIEYS